MKVRVGHVSFVSYSWVLLLGFGVFSCDLKHAPQEQVVERFGNYELTIEEINRNLPMDMSAEQRQEAIKNVIKRWYLDHYFVSLAEKELENLAELESKVEDYRCVLLRYHYMRKRAEETMKSFSVSRAMIEDYYTSFPESFLSEQLYWRYVLLELPLQVRGYYHIEKGMRDNDFHRVDSFLLLAGLDIGVDTSAWESLAEYPLVIANQQVDEKLLVHAADKPWVKWSNSKVYLLKTLGFVRKGEVLPLDLVERDIKIILEHKKRMEVIKELEGKAMLKLFRDRKDLIGS